VLKRVVRSPAAITLYRVLHPDVGWGLAHAVSRWSRGSREDRAPDTERLWREIAAPRFAAGYDTVMVGHFHQMVERREGAHTFFVLGDWLEYFCAVRLEGGAFTFERYAPPD
jgi:UDP-2,3-diacylglucosamine hydrolase